MYRKTLITVAVASALGAAIGCTRMEDRTIATVGKHKITFGEVDKEYSPRGLDTPEEKKEIKEKILNNLIEERLQLNEAEARGYADNEDLKKMLDDRRRILLINNLYKMEVVNKVKVKPSEVRMAYDMSSEELSLKHILVATEEEANAVHDSLIAGADFDVLASNKSIDPATKEKGGSLGWVAWGRLPDDVFQAASKLDRDGISKPVKGDRGWHIVMLVDRRPMQNRRPFEEEKKRIESRIKQNKMRERANLYLERLKERAGLTYDEDVVKAVAEKVPQESISPFAPAPLPNVTDEEKQRVLVTTRGDEWTVGRILEQGRKSPPSRAINTPEGLKQWVDMLILQELLVEEALRRRIDRSREVRQDIDLYYATQMVNFLHRDEVESKSEPTEEEVKAEFEANKDKYAIPEKNHVSVIITVTEDQAKDLLKALKKGADFEETAKEKSIHPSKRRGGKLGVVNERRNPDIFKAAQELKVGRLSKPVKVKEGWAIIKVTKREPRKMRTFEEARRLVYRDLNIENLRKNQEAFIAELKEKYPISINEKLLEQVGKKKEQETIEKEAEKKKVS
ncbi:MAG: peptidyl-prolyl cis-trans isomerase [bacterium]